MMTSSRQPGARDAQHENEVEPTPTLARDEHEYVLGTNDAELQRLGFQHRLWSRFASEAWEAARFGPGCSILDVGCGPGFATIDLAQLVGPSGRVRGVDVSSRFISHLQATIRRLDLQNVECRVGDVQQMDAVGDTKFDGAFARWVLCFASSPERVVGEVSRLLAPGGRFVVQDYVRYAGITLGPRAGAGAARVFDAVEESWRLRGGDPNVMQRVPAMLIQHGLTVESVRPIARAARPDDPLWRWPETFFLNYLPVLEGMGLIQAADSSRFREELDACKADPGGIFMTPPMLEVIASKPA